MQRVFQICAGYEDANDCDMLRVDGALKVACGMLPESDNPLASQPTMTRFENRVTKKELAALRTFCFDTYIASFKTTPSQIVLDIDAFPDITHGNQQLSFFNGFYKDYIYYPVFITDAPSGFPVLLQLRPGNKHSGKGVKGFLRWLFWRIRKAFPGIEIILRGDGGYSLPEVIQVCERSGVSYIFGFAKNKVLERKNEQIMELARIQFQSTGEKARLFHDVYYKAHSWGVPRRMIMKAEHLPQGPNQRFVVTNMKGDPTVLYDDFYVLRGEHSENRIKELKLDLKADRLSCSEYVANQFRLALMQISYLFMWHLKAATQGTTLAKAQFGTLRKKLLRIAARVKESSRRVWLQCSSTNLYQEVFHKVAAALSG
jgi:hypothetical protein